MAAIGPGKKLPLTWLLGKEPAIHLKLMIEKRRCD